MISSAINILRIAVGDEADDMPDDGKNKAAQALGKLGVAARAKGLTAKRRKEIAEKAAKRRRARDG